MISDISKILEGKKLESIGRVGSMCWIGFGEIIRGKNIEGKVIDKPEYALHLQCPWRIKNHNTILLASNDIYETNSTIEWSESFEWDVKGANLFDEKAKQFNDRCIENHVEKVEISLLSDIILYLSNEDILETFVDTSIGSECWRFLKSNSKEPHIVVPTQNR